MLMIFSFLTFFLSTTLFSATDKIVHIWPSIPFIKGADLCSYDQAFSGTRMQYMKEMTGLAEQLLGAGAFGNEALDLLVAFDRLYDKNLKLGFTKHEMDATLESTLKGYLDQLYRNIKPKNRKLSFRHANNIARVMNAAKFGARDLDVPADAFDYLDYVSYGTYSLAPNCQGDIQVTLTLVGRMGHTESFIAHGRPAEVMSKIASELFERFQKTIFPKKIKIGSKTFTLVGGLNGNVDKVNDLEVARYACETLEARLPNSMELELINAYGDWSGGISLSRKVWVVEPVRGGKLKVFHPELRNPSPVRDQFEVNDKTFYYFCLQDGAVLR